MRPSIRQHLSCWDLIHPFADCATIFAALWSVQHVAYAYFSDQAAMVGCAASLTFLLAGQTTGLYQRWKPTAPNSEILSIALTWTVTILGLSLISVVTRYGEQFARMAIFSWVILTPSAIALQRMAIHIGKQAAKKHGVGLRRVAVVGFNQLGLEVATGLRSTMETNDIKLLGFFDDRSSDRLPDQQVENISYRGKIDSLVELARRREVDMVLITLPMRAESRIRSLLEQLSDTTVSVYIIPDIFVFELLHSKWATVGGLPAVSLFETPFYGVDGAIKRVCDLIVASAALCVAAIPMAAIACLIKITCPGPVFFGQKRYGLDGQEIRVWKFRSMRTTDNGPVVKQATKDDPRITPLGRILRKTSLDELPQLFNVLEGSMSLVGPRPHASAHNEQYRKLIRGYMLRHKVKPGITGLAQVEGCRGETDTLDKMQRRVEFDHRYIRHWSIWLDLNILAKTLVVAWRQPEAY